MPVLGQTNDVSWSGEVNVNGSPASDGTQYSYELSDLDAVGNFTIDITGSTNTHTETVSATGVSSGSTVNLQIAGTDPAPAEVTFTGDGFNRWDNQTGTVAAGGSLSTSAIDGNLEPTGPSGNGEPVLTVANNQGAVTESPHNVLGDGGLDTDLNIVGDSNSDGTYNGEVGFSPSVSGQLTEITVPVHDKYTNIHSNVYFSTGTVDQSVSGTKVGEVTWNQGTGDYVITFSSPQSVTAGNEYHIEFEATESDGDGYANPIIIKADSSASSTYGWYERQGTYDRYGELYTTIEPKATGVGVTSDSDSVSFGDLSSGESASKEIDIKTTDDSLSFSHSGADVDATLKIRERKGSKDPAIDVDGDGTDEASYSGTLTHGSTSTKSLPDLAVGSSATVSTTSGTVDVDVTATEQTKTIDPTVETNGNKASYSGTLADGTTTSLTTDTAWLQSGTNTVNVSVGDGTLSSDAPTPQVGLSYSHDAADRITTNYTAEQWSERYNVSHQYSSDRSNAQLRIPFSKEVYDVKNVEMRVNGGTWTAVSSSDYTLEPRNLTVQIGSVSAGDTIEVRTTARKVKVANGDITVSEPSEPGQTLDSQIQINSWSDSAYIEVPEHKNWQQVHYTYNESWNAESYSVVDDTGYQRVHMPNAVGGDQARVSTIPLEVMPSNGDIQLEVVDASSTEPQVRVSAGEKIDDPVDYTHIDAKDDTDYILWSVTHETVRDSGTANSPLTLSDDDSDEVLEFRIDESGGDGGGGGGGGFWREPQQTVQQVQPALSPMAISGLFIGLLILSVGYTEYRKRRSSKPVYRRPLVWLAIGVGAFLSILLLNPMAITEPIQTALSATLPLAGVLGVIGVAAWLYMRQQQKNEEASTPDTVVEIAGQVSSNDSQESSDDGGGGWL